MRFSFSFAALTAAVLATAGCSNDDRAAEDGSAATGGTAGAGGTGAAGAGGTGAATTCPPDSAGTGGGGTGGGKAACSDFGPSFSSSKNEEHPGVLRPIDVDCDGKLDAVSTTYAMSGSGIHGLSVRRSKGDGTFEPPTILDLGVGPGGIVTGDFDGDAVTDLVVSTSAGLSLLRGDCAKGLQAPVVLVGPSPYSGLNLVSGDLNEDGIDDVVASRWDPPYTVEVLFGGAAPLQNKTISPTLVDKPEGLAVADVDGDGHLDVAASGYVGDEASSLQLLRNDGAGNLTQAAGIPVGGSLGQVTALDLDGDGADELVTARAYSSACDNKAFVDALHFDAKSGELTAQNLSEAREPSILDVGDVDADGRTDLAIAWPNSQPPHTAILLGGSSASAVADVPFAGSFRFGMGDVTGDGRADLVALVSYVSVPNSYWSESTLLEVFPATSLECQHQATNCGGPAAFGETAYPLKLPAERLVFGDVNGDGATDIVAIGKDGLGLLTNDGQGSFQVGPKADISGVIAVSVGRVGPSGAPVVVVADGSTGWTTLDGQGNVQKVSPQGFEHTYGVAVGEMTGDGKDDLAFYTVSTTAKESLLILPNADPAAAFEWSSPPFTPRLLGALDFDGDGDTDLLVNQSAGETKHRCVIRAPIEPSTPCEELPGHAWSWLDIGDFDGDQQADFLDPSHPDGVLFQTGTASPTTLLTLSEGFFSARVMRRNPTAGLLVGLKGGELRVYAGAGDGTLTPGPPLLSHQADRLLRYIDAEDLDGDGRDELVGIAWDPAPVLWVLRECP